MNYLDDEDYGKKETKDTLKMLRKSSMLCEWHNADLRIKCMSSSLGDRDGSTDDSSNWPLITPSYPPDPLLTFYPLTSKS